MIATRWRPYPETKDSGIEWLGQIPEYWEVKPLKHVANFVNGLAFSPSEWGFEGTPIIRIGNLNGGQEFNCTEREVPSAFHAYKGDLLFGWSGNRGTSFGPFLWWREGRHFVNQHIFRISEYSTDKTWLYWALRAATFYAEQLAHGIIGMVHITRGELGAISVPEIPIDEQQAIAKFLDRETAKIDALVEKKERLIELLQEKRTALITHAVTKGLPAAAAAQAGLDPDVSIRDSGIEWLGQIPAHWIVAPLRMCGEIRGRIGYRGYAVDDLVDENEGAITLSPGNITGDRLDLSVCTYLSWHKYEESPEIQIVAGDIILTKTGSTLGKVAIIPSCPKAMTINPQLVIIRSLETMIPTYLALVLGCSGIKAQYWLENSGGATPTVSQAKIGRIVLPLPPPDEQQAIANFLGRETARIDALIAKVGEAIERLKEYRTALISAAVTGKIDVREATQ